ncbi:DUF2550 family protein [Propionimicrobium lymphophilum]|uniref:DUF2550 family protein n=1 Tax=Propionimicrobium lymphophilum TaxID=33012 RepID=UPI003EC75AB0
MIVIAIALLALLVVIAILFRARLLASNKLAFSCSVRPSGEKRWRHGLAHYNGPMLLWYPVLGLGMRPKLIFSRSRISISRVEEITSQIGSIPEAQIIDLISDQPVGDKSNKWQLALSFGSRLGLNSWIEAAPPGGDKPGFII